MAFSASKDRFPPRLKVHSHEQICIHVQIFAYMQIYMCNSVHVNGFAQVCKICTRSKFLKFAPDWDQVQISICIYAEIKICVHEYLFICALLTLKWCCFNIGFSLDLHEFSTFDILLHNNWHFQLSKVFCTIFWVCSHKPFPLDI